MKTFRRTPPGGVTRRTDRTGSGRLPAVGLGLVVLLLSAFASSMAVASKRATDQLARSEQVGGAWQDATRALHGEVILSQEYLTEPRAGARHDLRNYRTEVAEALEVLAVHGRDAAAVDRFTAQHDRYSAGLNRLVAAVDRGDERTAERAHEEELEPIASALMFVAARSVERETRTTAEHLRALRRVQSIGMATPVVFGVGLLLLGLFLRVLRGYQRGMERQARENEHQALHDMLTGLPNRALLQQRTDAAIDSAADRGQQAALLLLDLDRFKEVNDTLGHHHGDLLLEQLARRLRAAVRDGDTLARLGGDEFAVLLPGADQEHAEAVGARLLGALTEPMMLDGILVTVDGSIGIAVYPDHAENGDELLRRADVAMYAAKETHAGYVVYDSHFDKRDTRRLGLLGELRRALAERELVLHYQPKASLRSGEVDGVEALVRWQHPQQGLLGPGEFIPLAERTGLIEPLTHYVLGEALSQTRSWLDEGIELTVSVNVPTRCLLDLDFPTEVGKQLDRCEVPAERLVLEITEGTIMQDPERSMRVLQRLRAMGVRLSIDDFGTGYSSMAYLKSLPVHELKVDRSFISQMSTNRSDEMIVTSTIELAHNLGLQIVAEGVEDRATWDHLNVLGCDSVQGYYLAKPMPAGKVADWLAGVAAPAPSATPAP